MKQTEDEWLKELDAKFANFHYDSIGWTGTESPEFYLKQFMTRAIAKAEARGYKRGAEETKKVETFGCELGMNHCVTGNSDCDSQSVCDGYCKS